MDDRDPSQEQAEMYAELEQNNLAALDRCYSAGGNFDDLHFLAAQLGVGDSFRRAHAATSPAHAC